ncbi:TrkA C-terminal domain-containing protein [Clostridium thermarum]|uniref:TrkA C-terminal domain-containing protein n=1 Tax=Clostridium thermarum TaxID=1716543 RepID=UPI001123DBDE|nr:TrkA C-terminal domain-containing protein [Clostridium thermarum]
MKSTSTPVYRNIALDIANKILRGEMKIKEKLSGRSTLAGMYNVSPETIRRAVALLEAAGVVEANIGSGIEILSITAAEKFIQQFRSNEYISSIKENMLNIMEKKRELDREFEENLEKVLDFLDRFKNITPFALIEVKIGEDSPVINRKVLEVKFWQKTGATIIAYRRAGETVVSPGPGYTFCAGDTIFVIGDNDVYEKVSEFIKNYKEEN